jgi:hypothetical protein
VEYSYNNESLRRHEITRTDVDEVLAVDNPTTRDFDLPLSNYGRLRLMFVGYNFSGRLLEIGVEFISEIKAHIFHAQTVSPRYRKFYNEKIAKA